MLFHPRDRERLEAIDRRQGDLITKFAVYADRVDTHNRRCEKWQAWGLGTFVLTMLVVLGFLVKIAFHLPTGG